MSKSQSDQNSEAKKSTGNKPAKHLSTSKQDSPMARFNTAMRKILSVPKKNLKDK